MRQARILIMDDLEKWREELVGLLARNGYTADSVSTATELLERLKMTPYHVLLLDIRMDDANLSNIDGMKLLSELDKRDLGEAVKVIMLSAYGTKEHMRTAFREYKVADFLSKDDFNGQVLLESVGHVFSKNVNINLELEIRWLTSAPEEFIINLDIEGIHAKRGTPLQSQMAVELEDLLCRLFYQARSIIVQPLTSDQNNTGMLLIQPFYTTGGGSPVVVKVGDFRKIEQEYYNFKEYVEPFIGGGRNTAVLDVRHTLRLGGIIYSFLSASNDHWKDFGSFYLYASVSQIRDVLDQLFLDTCGAWYASPGLLNLYDLTIDYQQSFCFIWEQLEQTVAEQLQSVQGKYKLYFKSLKSQRLFTNPLMVIAGQSFVRSTYVCTTHGNFNQHNFLVDSTGHVWLINFQETGQSHILRDVAALDSAVRFQLLTKEEATLDERLQMEEVLLENIERFSQVEQLTHRFPTQNPALAKTYDTVVHLRRLARKLVEQNPNDDISEYYIALLYNALNTLRFSSLSSCQREHALLAASLLADQLGLGEPDGILPNRDTSEVLSAIGNKSFHNYQRLAEAIIRCMGVIDPILIESQYFEHGTVWEVLLPEIGLQLTTQRAILLLRQKEEKARGYKELLKRAQGNALIIIIDIANVPHSPFQASPRTIWFSPESLIEMIETSQDQLPGWLGRFIMTRVEKNVKQTLLPYATDGATKLFVGREYELTRLTRIDRLGGIITGAHQSGKSSLLLQLGKQLREDGLKVIGPLDLGGIGFQTFFERTLKHLGIVLSAEVTPESWAAVLRNYSEEGPMPIFLLDEVDDLLELDAQKGFSLGRQMRSLQNEGQCKFYLAGHDRLREATHQQYGPFRNFANVVLLTGVTQEASKQLIQRPTETIGFSISNEQAARIFQGTAGVPFLIQDFFIHLLCNLPPNHVSKPEIEDSEIAEVEASYDYQNTVIEYYKYAQEWDAQCIMLITALREEASRQDITQEFVRCRVPLGRTRLDDQLQFLIDFGVLKPVIAKKPATADLYTILPGYLYQAIKAREPESLLNSLLAKGKQEG